MASNFCILFSLFAVPAFAFDTVFTSTTYIAESDFTYDGQSVLVDGVTLTINGSHSFSELVLTNAATLTHGVGFSGGMELSVTNLTLPVDCTINVNSRGLGFSGTGRSGGSYGGRGANSSGSSSLTYGDLRSPSDLGRGGNNTRGGGLVKIIANTLDLDGDILAEGQDTGTSFYGGGSGGSIWLDIGTLTGSGLIGANGGNAAYSGGCGGGGRIAIYYDDASGFDLVGRIQNKGGDSTWSSSLDGAAGTIYLKDNAEAEGFIRINNTGLNVASSAATEFRTNLTEVIELTYARSVFYNSVTSLTFSATNSPVTQDAPFSITNLTVAGQSWTQTTNGTLSVQTLSVSNVTWTQEAALEAEELHAGNVVWTQNESLTAGVFDVTGGSWMQNDDLTITSTTELSLDGTHWTQNGDLINVDSLNVANLTWNQNTNQALTSLSLSNAVWSQNGTLDLSDLSISGGTFTLNEDLSATNLFDVSGVNLIQNASLTLPSDDIIVDGWTWTLNVTQMWDQISIINTGLLTHSLGSTQLEITATSFLVDSNSSVDVTSRGLGFSGTGRSGGSYGGRGANSSGSSSLTYGDLRFPSDLGRGGNNTRGGGLIKITANTLDLDGDILAEGQDTGTSFYGGGSGGSIWLDIGTLTGSGLIGANGGNAAYSGGCGGGGRIAIYYDDASGFDLVGRIQNKGGDSSWNSGYDGAAGTTYLKDNAEAEGLIRINNTGLNVGSAATTELRTNLTEAVELTSARSTFYNSVTSLTFSATNSPVTQDAPFSITNLTVAGQSWTQTTNGTLSVQTLSVSNVTWTQEAALEAGEFSVEGGSWVQNAGLTVLSSNLTAANVTWTQNGELDLEYVTMTGGTWNQNTNQALTSLSLSNTVWNQGGALDLSDLQISGGTFTINEDLSATNLFDVSGVNLIQNASLTLPSDDIIVDGWTWTLNVTQMWDQISIINTGLLTHSLGSTQLVVNATGFLVDSNSSVNVNSRGLGFSGTGRSGGSYGGRGANSSGSSSLTYGDLRSPSDLGRGGNNTRGGGLIKITANTLDLDGDILAEGQDTGSSYYGGGSGGSIWLDIGTLTGSGLIGANGGNAAYSGGCGGGGRIAIYYDDASGFDLAGRIQNKGGDSSWNSSLDGAAGTIYLKDNAEAEGFIRINNTGLNVASSAATEFRTNLTEVIELTYARSVFYNGVTSLTFSATNSPVTQDAPFSITNLTVAGQSWTQTTNGTLSVQTLSVSNVTWTQDAALEAGELSVEGGTWVQNAGLTVLSSNLTAANVTWTQNEVLGLEHVTLTGGTWNQNTNQALTSLSLSNTVWSQNRTLDLSDLSISGGTFTINEDLSATNLFDVSGVNLIQNASLTLPSDDIIVDGWTWTLNVTQMWDQISIINTGLLTHSLGSTQLVVNATSFLVDSNSSVDVTSRGWTFNGAGNSGGSHGGRAVGYSGASAPTYGDLRAPSDPGRGGRDTRGGGRIKITAGTLDLDGFLLAEGQTAGSTYDGGGAGGSIWLDVETLTGSGQIRADGGNSTYYASCGGGGRIAIYYDDASGFDLAGRVQSKGGDSIWSSSYDGAAGTIYLKDNAEAEGFIRINNTGLGLSSAATEFKTNLTEVIELTGTRSVFYNSVTTLTFTATNSIVTQDALFSITNLMVEGQSWTQTTNGPLNVQTLSVSNVTWTQNADIEVGALAQSGGTWVQNAELTVLDSNLEVENITWTQNDVLHLDHLSAVGSTWNQNTNQSLTSLSISNVTWNQSATLEVADLSIYGGTFTMNEDLSATNTFIVTGVNLIQNAGLTLPSDDIIVDDWTWTLNVTQLWDEVSIINGGLLTHSAGNTQLVVHATSFLVDSNSSVDVTSRGWTFNGTGQSGGSHGGRGRDYSGVSAATYGDLRAPSEPGRGGRDTRGGGRIKLTAGLLNLNGLLLAEGQSTTVNYDGGGAGGSVWLDVGTLTGTGQIRADGGNCQYYAGSGGGGRIAIYYDDASGFDLAGRIQNKGGDSIWSSSYDGAAGTIYLKDKAEEEGFIRINNTGLGVASAATEFKTNLTEGVELTGTRSVFYNSVTTLTFTATNSIVTQDAPFSITNLSVTGQSWTQTTNGTLSVQTLSVSNVTWTQNADIEAGVLNQIGGSWVQNAELTVQSSNLEVENITWTQNDVLNLEHLTASGSTWNQNTNQSLTSLSISNVTWNQSAALEVADLSIYGGTFTMNEDLSATNTFIVTGVNLIQNAGLTLPSDDIIVDDWTWTLNVTQMWDEVSIINGGLLTHSAGNTQLVVHATSFLVDSNSSVDVTSRGWTFNGTGQSGGSHGGRGRDYSGVSAATYGDLRAPSEPGRGGRDTRGGGRIKLTAGLLNLNGLLLAEGQSTTVNYDGGGAGGSVWLDVGTLTGTGQIRADGGNCQYYAGSGGGGRIAIYYDDASGFDLAGRIQNKGGDSIWSSSYDGAAGTIYLKDKAEEEGFIRINNTGLGVASAATEFKTNLTEGVELTGTRSVFYNSVTTLTFTATNSIVTQDAAFSITNLSVSGQSWTQTTNGLLSVQSLSVDNVSWNQQAQLDAGSIIVNGGTWTQAEPVTVPVLETANGTWNQNAALNVSGLKASAMTWNQNVPLTVPDFNVDGGTYIVNDDLTVTNLLTLSGLSLVQNADFTTPSGNLEVNNWTYTLNVSQRWNQISITEGGLLTHGVNVTGVQVYATSMLIDSNSSVDVTARGRSFAGSGSSGGSYGGLGAAYAGSPNPVYGDEYEPVDLGTGGRDTRGGGTVKIVSDFLQLDGDILAKGQTTSVNNDGGGSGGSIWLDAIVLTGSGSIDAGGGGSGYYSGAGGGGRIAVYYDDASGFDLATNVLNNGGDGYSSYDGQTGTVFFLNRTNAVRVLSSSPVGAVPNSVDAVEVLFNTAVNPATFTTNDLIAVGPSGVTNVPVSVTQSNAVTFVAAFSPALGENAYDLLIGPDIFAVNGLGMDQDEDDTTGESSDDIYTSSFEVDLTDPAPPVVTNYLVSPTVNHVTETIVTLEGTREANTAVWVDGDLTVSAGSAPWAVPVSLAQGSNTVAVSATDLSGRRSATNEYIFFADSVAPVITGIRPPNFTFTNSGAILVEADYTEVTSLLSLTGSVLSVKQNDVTDVPGIWVEDGSTATFTPSNTLADATYFIDLEFADTLGNLSDRFESRFTVDTVAPDPVVINPYPAVTGSSNITFSGSREAYAEVRLDGVPVAGSSPATAWSHSLVLGAFSNTYVFTQVDRAGNVSSGTVVEVYYADPPAEVTAITLPAEGSTNNGVITSFGLAFSEPVTLASATNPANYILQGAGGDETFGNGDDAFYDVNILYSGGTTAQVDIVHGPIQTGRVQFVISSALTDMVGNTMTGDVHRNFRLMGVPDYLLENRTNNSFGTATVLSPVEDPVGFATAGGRGSIGFAGETDVWSFAASSGDDVAVAVDSFGNPVDSQLRYQIVDTADTLLAEVVSDNNGYGQSPAVAVPSNGTYYVKITEEDAYRGEYRIRLLRGSDPLVIENESNGSIGTATPLPLTPSGVTNIGSAAGTFAFNSDLDYFDLGTLTNDLTVLLSTRIPASSAAQPRVGVYNSANQLIAEANLGDPNDGLAEVRMTNSAPIYARVQDGASTRDLNDRYVLDVDVVPTASLVLPDLQVEDLVMTGSNSVGETVFLSWNHANRGTGPTAGGFYERIIVSNITRGTVSHNPQRSVTNILAPSEMVARSYDFVPVSDGLHEIRVITDSQDDQYEWQEGHAAGEANNVWLTNLLVIQYWDIELRTNNPVGGTLTGGGTYTAGETVTVVAVANTNVLPYYLESWTEGAAVQSSNSVYSFVAAADRTLTGTFTLPEFDVTTAAQPPAGGTLTGAGTYFYGDDLIVSAVTNPGYGFIQWQTPTGAVSALPTWTTTVTTNLDLTAVFFEKNLSHTVTTASDPVGITPVSGSGVYTNGQVGVISASAGFTNANLRYDFLHYLRNGVIDEGEPVFTNVFTTADPSNITYTAVYDVEAVKPTVVVSWPSRENPVPETTNFYLTVRFDRSMLESPEPRVELSNSVSGAVLLSTTNGFWSETSFPNDTYRTPFFSFTNGMDGVYTARVSVARALDNEVMDPTNVLTVIADVTAPPSPVLTQSESNRVSITVDWSSYVAPGDLAGYRLYRDTLDFSSVVDMTPLETLTTNFREFVFTDLTIDQMYFVALTAVDEAGNEDTDVTTLSMVLENAGFAPAPPVVDPVSTPTTIRRQTLTGTKEAGVDLRVNDVQEIPVTPSTNWSWQAVLNPGTNVYSFRSADTYGFLSDAVEVEIVFQDTPPGPVLPEVDGEGNGLSAFLIWTNYDVVANGDDIAYYELYQQTNSFTNVNDAVWIGSNMAASLSFTATGLVRNTSMDFAVRAVDLAGNKLDGVTSTNVIITDVVAPANPSGLSFVSGATNLLFQWQAPADPDGDLAGYNVYVTNNLVPVFVPASTNGLLVTGLEDSTAYDFNIRSLDESANESSGVDATGVTWLPNPSNLTAQAADGRVTLTWDAASPQGLISTYAIYRDTSPFTNLTGRTPVKTSASTTRAIAGLQNGIPYHFAVATVNLSGSSDPQVTTVSATPVPDLTGPVLGDLRYDGIPLTNGTLLTRSGEVSAQASDVSGVSRVEFFVNGSLRGYDARSDYIYLWDINTLSDGPHTLRVDAYDALNNRSTITAVVSVALAPPAVTPVITSPSDGFINNRAINVLSGTTDPFASQVQLYINGSTSGAPKTVTAQGLFEFAATFSEGTNAVQVAAVNRAGTGDLSEVIDLIVDTSVPAPPTRIAAKAQDNGVIRVTWRAPTDDRVNGYVLYRSTSPFIAVGEAERLNTDLITTKLYEDLPFVDGTYYYRLVSENYLGTESAPSEQASATSDRTPPVAMLTYGSSGSVVGSRYSTGTVSVALTVSESLLVNPFFSMVRTNGAPIPVALTQITTNQYLGNFEILGDSPQGMAFATFSGRDVLGNRGTEVSVGQSILIDTKGPVLDVLTVNPGHPIQNVASNPVSVAVGLTFDANDVPTSPELFYGLSESGATGAVPLTATSGSTWTGQLTLAASAGATNEFLTFSYRGVDMVDNVGTQINGSTQFLVYQGGLPSLDAPTGLVAQASADGVVELSWNPVDAAVDYAVYRQGPAEGSAQFLTLSTGLVTLVDVADDGTNLYSVASLWQANSQASTSALSAAVAVVADSTPPAAPSNLFLSLSGAGVAMSWVGPTNESPLTYNVYRDVTPISSVSNLSVLIEAGQADFARDASPLAGGAYYAVTALDALGNESVPSSSSYTNISLVPVNGLSVLQQNDELPVLAWTHADASSIAGFRVYLNATGTLTRLTNPDLANTTSNYVDTGFTGDSRTFAVAATDGSGTNIVESEKRTILLPDLDLQLQTNSQLERGVLNRLVYTVSNAAPQALSNITLGVEVEGYGHQSDLFHLDVGGVTSVAVAVAGHADLSDNTVITNLISIVPNEGESVGIVRSEQVEVGDATYPVDLVNDELLRGTSSDVKFIFYNTGDQLVELVTAVEGDDSPSLRFKLVDSDGSVYAAVPFRQLTGNVITRVDGITLARIAPGESWTSDAVSIYVPASAPVELQLRLEIDTYYTQYGESNQVSMAGATAAKTLTLGNYVTVSGPIASTTDPLNAATEEEQQTQVIQLTYTAEATNATPALLVGDGGIELSGWAYEREDNRPVPRVPVRVVVAFDGFKRAFNVFTDENGEWTYTYEPTQFEGGPYSAYAQHPYTIDQRDQVQFEIHRVLYGPKTGEVEIPREYPQAIDLNVAPVGLSLTNVQLAYLAEDQPGEVFAAGLTVASNTVVSVLQDGSLTNLMLQFSGDATAPTSGTVVFRVTSDAGPSNGWGLVELDYTFVEPPGDTPANVGPTYPALTWKPDFIETGVAISNSVEEEVTLYNLGYGPMEDIQLSMVDTNGNPAPDWVILNAASNAGAMAVGDALPVGVLFRPGTNVATSGLAPYEYRLKVESTNHGTREVQFFVHVDNSGMGNALFKVMDIYTGTFDAQTNLIEGVDGARVRLVKEEGTVLITNLVTDALGEVFVQDLPVGRYSVQVDGPAHFAQTDRITVRPGATVSREYTLNNNLISVFFNVREITIEDRYEIVLDTTFETDVPAAVVISSPKTVVIPDMEVGEVYHGEINLKNYGLIQAEQVTMQQSAEDEFYRFELLDAVPEILGAHEEVNVPYRITKLADLLGGGAAGEGCRDSVICSEVGYTWKCINGSWQKMRDETCITRSECGGGDSPGGGDDTGSNDGGTDFIWPSYDSTGGSTSGGWFSGSGGASGNWGITYFPGTGSDGIPTEPTLTTTPPRTSGPTRTQPSVCGPKPDDDDGTGGGGPGGGGDDGGGGPGGDDDDDDGGGDEGPAGCADDDACCQAEADEDINSQIDLATGTYQDDAVDLSIRIQGHDIDMRRFYLNGNWYFDVERQHLQPRYQLGLTSSQLVSIVSAGATYEQADTEGSVFTYGNRYIFVESNSFTRVDPNGDYRLYDGGGRLMEVGDRNFNRYLLQYDGSGDEVIGYFDHYTNQVLWLTWTNGRPESVSDQATGGREVFYDYDSENRLTNVVNVLGEQTVYRYDGTNGLVYKGEPGGIETYLTYNAEGYITSFLDQDGNGKYFEYGYDVLKQEYYALVETTDGHIFERWFDRYGRQIRRDVNGTQVSKPPSSVARTEINDRGRITMQVYTDGTLIERRYDPILNVLVWEQDEAGIETVYQYDTSGNLTNLIEAAGTAEERVTRKSYDSMGNLVKVVEVGDANTPEAVMMMSYDNFGNMISKTDAENNTQTFTYNARGLVTSQTTPTGHTWTNMYDAAGHVLTTRGPLGYVVSNVYNAAGQIWKHTDALGGNHVYTYDSQGRIHSRTDPFGNTWRRYYDSEDRLIKEVDPDGVESGWAYDDQGRKVKAWPAQGYETTYSYDSLGNLVQAVLPDGSVSTMEYDAYGNRNKVMSPQRTQQVRYDARGRVLSSTITASNQVRYTGMKYDSRGLLNWSLSAEGTVETREYDAMRRITEQVVGGTRTNRMTYDNRGNMISFINPEGVAISAVYNSNDQPVAKIYPDGTSNTVTYTALGYPDTLTFGDGRRRVYSYDELGRNTAQSFYSPTSVVPDRVVQMAYDMRSRLTNWSDGTFSESIGYDDAQRRVVRTVDYGSFSKTVVSRRNHQGKVVEFTDPSTNILSFSYNPQGQIRSVDIANEGSIVYSLSDQGRIADIALPGGSSQRMAFGPFAIESHLVLDPVGDVIMDNHYTVDREDMLTEYSSLDGACQYDYDAFNQLSGYSTPSATNQYFFYDHVGNRITGPGGTENYQYNDLNQVLSRDLDTFAYDDAGHMTRSTQGGVTRYYQWDASGRLSTVLNGSSNVIARYAYDPFGRRLMKETGGETIYYVYGEKGVIGEYDSSGQEIRAYGYSPGGLWGTDPLYMRTGGDYYYYIKNFRNDSHLLIAKSGAVVWQAEIDPFGAASVDPTSTVVNNFRISSQYYDEETGLHYNLNRYYSPSLGRYISRDPVEESGGINVYAFTHNNPLNSTDPLGLYEFKETWYKVNCERLDFNVSTGIGVGITLSIKGGLNIDLCDCCTKDTGKYLEYGYSKHEIYVNATLAFGLKVETPLFEIGVDLVRIPYTKSVRRELDCGARDVDFISSEKVSIDNGVFIEASAGLFGVGVGANQELGGSIEVERGIKYSACKGLRLFIVAKLVEIHKAGGGLDVNPFNDAVEGGSYGTGWGSDESLTLDELYNYESNPPLIQGDKKACR